MKIFIDLFICICSLLVLLPASGNALPVMKNTPFNVSDFEKISFTDEVYADYIKTVEFYRSGWRLSPPFRNIRDTSRLVLEFDDLSLSSDTYTYTMIHCTADWKPSDIINSQYINGIPVSEIRDFNYSRNTLQPYTHYTLSLPNEDMEPKIPGNYLLYVFKDYDQEAPILTRRFFLVDPKVKIDATAHRTDNLSRFDSAQEIDFIINYENLPLDDPRRNIRVTLCQNYNFLTAITDLQPNYIQPDRLIYEYDDVNLFSGGSEFRYFDTKNLKYNSERISEIRFERPLKHVYLHPDSDRSRETYDYYEDLNGRFFIKWDEASDNRTEADYVQVHFTLLYPEPAEGGDFYIFGGLTGFAVRPEARMTYNNEAGAYETTMLLKQGYYNYQYVFKAEGKDQPIFNLPDGSFYETENDYYLFVYFRDIRERFDRLVGLQAINSVRLEVK